MDRRFLVCAFLLLVVGVAAACLTLAHPRHAGSGQVIGVIDEPRSDALRIRAGPKDASEIGTDANTHYIKWLTHQPWTIDTLVNADSLTVGRCVKVTLRRGDLRVAQRVEISLDRPGTFDDPCKSIR